MSDYDTMVLDARKRAADRRLYASRVQKMLEEGLPASVICERIGLRGKRSLRDLKKIAARAQPAQAGVSA